jgi:ribosomal protein S18 acetylase RimI-like enzyme
MAESGTNIRLAQLSDLPAILALTATAYRRYLSVLDAPPVPMTEDYSPRIEIGQVWLLEGSAGTAGLIVLERHTDHAEIFSVAVDPSYHGGGLGRKLLDFAVEKTREWGLSELRLYTNAKMARNIDIYRRYGFRETGRRAHPKRPQFTIVDMAIGV